MPHPGFERLSKGYIRELLEIDYELLRYLKVQNHLYSLWGYLTLEAARRLTPEELAPRYRQFLDSVKARLADPLFVVTVAEEANADEFAAEARYALNFRGASTDLPARRARHAALVVAMHGTEMPVDEGQ